MKYLFGLLLLLPMSSFAQSTLTKSELKLMAGEYTFDILKNPKIKALLKSVLGKNKFAAFVDDTATAGPAELLDGRFLVAMGCVPHNCGGNESIFAIDIQNPNAVLIKIQVEGQNTFYRSDAWSDSIGEDNESSFASLNAKLHDQ